MKRHFPIDIHRQPDDISCGPTCLHAIYQFYDDVLTLEQVIDEIPMLDGGGTLGALLGAHALRSGYHAILYTNNLKLFDPTWFGKDKDFMLERLQRQLCYKDDLKFHVASQAYIEFLELGGELRMSDLTYPLIKSYLDKGQPILTGLSATYLYRACRVGLNEDDDDLRGEPAGHFVLLCGFDDDSQHILVADPYLPNLTRDSHLYEVDFYRLMCAILLGVFTYDGNLLIIEPKALPGNNNA